MKIGKIDSTSIQIKNNKIADCQSKPAASNIDNTRRMASYNPICYKPQITLCPLDSSYSFP